MAQVAGAGPQAGEPAKLLSGKRVLVTGASRGIGQAIAEAFAEQGALLVLAARSQDRLQEVAKQCRAAGAPSCDVLHLDQADTASLDALAKQVLERWGAVDVLVNNAGISEGGSDLLTGDPDGWDRTIDINLLGPMRLTARLAPAMAARGGGVIINTGSLAGTKPMEKNLHYAASKWGVRGWALACYEELRCHGIKTLVLEPGFVATDMTVHQEGVLPERMIQPQDMALAALLPFRMSAAAQPLEVVLKLAKGAYKEA